MSRPITKRNHEFLDSMVIGSGHTILAGYIPPSIPANEFSDRFFEITKKDRDSIQQLGFWGGDIDYNTYYPDLDPEQLTPKDEEFIEPMFRLLSQTIVSKNYNPTDFSKGNVLKASMPLLLGQTVNCDHETNIGNAIGAVSKVVWQDAYKDGDFVIPGGINGVLKIDGKANPRIARGILMDPPSIHSNSVTVQFKWDKSHPDMEDGDFYHKLGTYDENGVMIRRVVTEVVRYLETSLVSHGADTFAQKIGGDGKIVNPEFARRTWNSYSEYQEDTKKDYYFTDFKSVSNFIEKDDTTGLNNIQEDNPQTNQSNNTMTLEEFISQMCGENLLTLAEGQEQSPENVMAAFKAVMVSNNTLSEEVTNLKTEKQTLSEKVTNLETQVANLKEMATVGTNHIASLREEAVNNYKKLKGDRADEALVTMLNAETTGLVTLISMNKDFKEQLEEKFPLTCKKCGSHDVNRASAIKENEETTQNEETVNDTQSVMKGLYNEKMK